MQVVCNKCNYKLEVDLPENWWEEFVCPRCSYITFSDSNNTEATHFNNTKIKVFSFKLGEHITYKGTKYQLISIAVKKVSYHTEWIEYTFINNKGVMLYFSVSDGHWIVLHDMKKQPAVLIKNSKTRIKKELYYNRFVYNLYSKDNVDVTFAEGVFNYLDSTKRYELAEYINPPSIISAEFRNFNYNTIFGQHISKEDMRKLKPTIEMPKKVGVGIVEPYKYDVYDNMNIYLFSAVIILTFYLCSIVIAKNKEILKVDFDLKDTFSQELRSKSFELNGLASAPLTFEVNSNNYNSWTSTTVELINDKTNESRIASKDVEYYHGIDGGESWSEGSNNKEFNMCGVPAGTYHLVISGLKDNSDLHYRDMNIKVIWDKPSFWNAGLALLAIFIIAIINFYIARRHDQNRWSNSDFDIYYDES